jgi:hypothetical protein
LKESIDPGEIGAMVNQEDIINRAIDLILERQFGDETPE